MTRKIRHSHMTSLRLPRKWDQWIKQFADQWEATPAYIYRAAIRDFIKKQGGTP